LVEIAKNNWVEKFLYLQSACIFSWEDSPYHEDSIPNPKHYYGFTKTIAEEIIKSYDSNDFKTLIARTNFTTMPWEYEKAFTDRFWTYLFAQWVAKWMKEFLEDNRSHQIIHLCWDKKISMYEYAKLWWSNVWELTMLEYRWVWLTRDMSLISNNWHTYKIEDSNFNDN
jgi:dTDP-4-dehydrorhamnose reductase